MKIRIGANTVAQSIPTTKFLVFILPSTTLFFTFGSLLWLFVRCCCCCCFFFLILISKKLKKKKKKLPAADLILFKQLWWCEPPSFSPVWMRFVLWRKKIEIHLSFLPSIITASLLWVCYLALASGYNRIIKYYYEFIYNIITWNGLDWTGLWTTSNERKKEKSQKSVGENDELINKRFWVI